MPQSMPSAPVLLTAAVKYLEEELLPTLTGYHRFQTRVTANVLNIVRRELELRETQSAAEHERLRALVGHDSDTESLSRELSVKAAILVTRVCRPGVGIRQVHICFL